MGAGQEHEPAENGDAREPEDELQVPERIARMRTSPQAFRDDNLAPEVDRDVLTALVRRELPYEQAQLVYELIYSFRSWSEAHTEVLIEEFRKAN